MKPSTWPGPGYLDDAELADLEDRALANNEDGIATRVSLRQISALITEIREHRARKGAASHPATNAEPLTATELAGLRILVQSLAYDDLDIDDPQSYGLRVLIAAHDSVRSGA